MKFTGITLLMSAMAALTNPVNALPSPKAITPTIPSVIRPDDPHITITCTNTSVSYVDGQQAATKLGNLCKEQPVLASEKISQSEDYTRVYFCNYNGEQENSCSYEQSVKAQNAIMGQCGVNVGGYWYDDRTATAYGVDNLNVWFCEGLDF